MGKVLVLGHTGKLGRALARAFAGRHEVVGHSASTGFDATDFPALRRLLEALAPGIVVNAAALNGLGPCEADPGLAFRLNSLLPRALAASSGPLGFQLLHFSTDAVFDGARAAGAYAESDPASPINTYGVTKFGGDCYVRSEAGNCCIFRLSMLAGDSRGRGQFVERMIARARAGEALRIADDIVCSPSYVADVVEAVVRLVGAGLEPGLYHLANGGQASLYELIREITDCLGLAVPVQPMPHLSFPFPARKNPYTPLRSEKLQPLRDWREAIRAYCATL